MGDGAALSYEYLKNEGIACRVAPQNLVYQSAWGVGMEALRAKPGTADDLLPVYLRLNGGNTDSDPREGTRSVSDGDKINAGNRIFYPTPKPSPLRRCICACRRPSGSVRSACTRINLSIRNLIYIMLGEKT